MKEVEKKSEARVSFHRKSKRGVPRLVPLYCTRSAHIATPIGEAERSKKSKPEPKSSYRTLRGTLP